MSQPRQAECPECLHQFPVSRDEGNETQCPKCEFGLLVEWTDDEDGESVRLVLPEIFFVPSMPPTGTVEAMMAAVEYTMFAQVGIPAHLVGGPLPERVDLREGWLSPEQTLRYIQQTTITDRFSTTMLEECRKLLSIRTQAEYMGMRLENNRKRMRKRVRQRRRRWTILDEHWTNNPNGDW